ncbi:MAG: TetR family transcriptional regulator [Thalassolituus sp.]|jgi:AcrR family transcriptional regulator|uniref:Transcriptional regulator PsrA n=1 Tax=Thalassolituus maritimus TaxID=484498 RepID=A0ABP9ZZR2_9GAMM|nr:TetR/AcrR family transcriptional regulator [Pseudomonadota bacterium]MEC8103740.1 TetR/AcrR family transcriptional regulator [Pseudomonadota bacterium]MEC8523083.1 TetR/AcrR family transcriptional regulator [Pseudomonadota bacterium]MEE2748452.1 TetR/AcrR family transcriptional regulator [Pseudomonadota bacterium]TNC86341.1 MAG: TetR family transcriptional regulator [Thalassolituus sp.]|tara:strand:+ start:1252 stop:1893 length:642 start_codon:yes stop_codon:yes gene_type:complete
MAQKETARSILDAAEELFSERGFAETSLRNITTKADVNLAAVNYHFGSKKALIQAVFARFLTPFVAELDTALNDWTKNKDADPTDLMALLRLLSDTALRSGAERPERLRIFMRLLGLAYSQGQGHLRRFIRVEYGQVFRRYSELLSEATPELSHEDRFWRFHFMLGATMFTLNGVDSLSAMAEHDLGKATTTPDVIEQLLPFLASGLQSPVGS